MRPRLRLAAGVLAAAGVVACSNPLGRQYEYDEQTYLTVDGRATVVVNTSLPALVALRGARVDPKVDGAADRDGIKQLYESAGCTVDKVGRFWYRRGRRFVQIQVSANDVRSLTKCGLLSWSSYVLGPDPVTPDGLQFKQDVGAPAGGDPGTINWDGSELIAFKLHAPSRIRYHNVKKLDGTDGTTERGNIFTWEQTLADRRSGKPLAMEVRMDSTSILYTTIWLFAGAFVAAVGVLVFLIWMTIRKGRQSPLKP
ncbi:MAG TPA: hypothetical protein VN700_10325 [Vicinamibacterales bacterium]|nr:hypothetical protein [Vicinamibacterales bacterium]